LAGWETNILPKGIEMPESDNSDVEHVVILVHGIRTDAPWQNTLRFDLEKQGIRVELTNYGWFGLSRFLVPFRFIREIAINRVWNQVKDICQLYPNAKTSFLAHSFGTYIVANILSKDSSLKAFRVVFCGSVVRYDFPFHEVSERFLPPIINEVGSRDFLPALAESITWGYGSAGTYGFRVPRVRDRWHNNLSHSMFLTHEFCKEFWIPYFAEGKIIDADDDFVPPPFYIRFFISRLSLKYLIVMSLVAGIYLAANPGYFSFVSFASYLRAWLPSLISTQSQTPTATSTLCYFFFGPRAGQIIDYAPMAPIPVGSRCQDGAYSIGFVIPRN
jgi:hypothetical protein